MMNLTVKELRGLAKENGLKGYSNLRKAELIELLNTNGVLLETKSTSTEQVEENIVHDDYTDEVAYAKDWSDEQLAQYLGLDSDDEEEFVDNSLGIHVTKDMINEEDTDIHMDSDEKQSTAPDNCNENKTFEDIMLAWEKEQDEYQEVYGDKAGEVKHSEQIARYSEEAITFEDELKELEKVVEPRTYAEIMAAKQQDNSVEDIPVDRLEAKQSKDKQFYNEHCDRITSENIGNNHIISGSQAKYLQDLFLNFKITIQDDIYTAEKASEKLNAINNAIAGSKLTKRKCTVAFKNRPTVAQLQTIINRQGFVNIMTLPKTKAEASKLISSLNKKQYINRQQVEKEIAVTSINKKVDTLTKAKNSDRGGFKNAIKKFFSRLFN